MKKSFYKAKNYQTDHSTFGGLIYASDFNTNCGKKDNKYGSPIASRIINDQKFDNQCKKFAKENQK